MEYRRLGKSGLQVSALSFGSWVTFGNQVGDPIAEECMKVAYDNGINFFDNAETYANGKSETVMGNILKKMGWDRTSYVVSSKVFWGGKLPNQMGLSRKHVMEACHAALKRLQVDYLDLYFCHRPDRNTPVEETVRAMHDLIVQGKVLYWGTSEWSAQQIMEAYSVARQYNLTPPTMEQPQYNMFHRERFEVEYARLYPEIGLGTTIWSPLASGLLTGKYNNGIPDDTRIHLPTLEWLKEATVGDAAKDKIEKVKKLDAFAKELGTTLPRMALAWCLKNNNVSTVITGASKVEQLKDNLHALEVVEKLTEDVMLNIETILQNKPVQSKF
ncbi:MAG: aldo/keto reductase [Bacteroidetes bacterium]|jgi:voltage-dependent potassium channel beta subunit|nr:aldo/keto reductase [Bacteroidota bacterium]